MTEKLEIYVPNIKHSQRELVAADFGRSEVSYGTIINGNVILYV